MGDALPRRAPDAIVSASTLMSSLPSPQGKEVSGHLVQVFRAKASGRHERARLQDAGSSIQDRILSGVFWITPAPMVRRSSDESDRVRKTPWPRSRAPRGS